MPGETPCDAAEIWVNDHCPEESFPDYRTCTPELACKASCIAGNGCDVDEWIACIADNECEQQSSGTGGDAGSGGSAPDTTHPECIGYANLWCQCLSNSTAECFANIVDGCDYGMMVCPTSYAKHIQCVMAESCAPGWTEVCAIPSGEC